MNSEIDIEKLAEAMLYGTSRSRNYYGNTDELEQFAEAYHKAKCEQSEPFGIWHVADDPDECDFFLYKDSGDVLEKGDIYLYDTPPDQTAEIERLKAREARLLEALKRTMCWVVTQKVACHGMKCRELVCESCNSESEENAEKACAAYSFARELIKEIEAENE